MISRCYYIEAEDNPWLSGSIEHVWADENRGRFWPSSVLQRIKSVGQHLSLLEKRKIELKALMKYEREISAGDLVSHLDRSGRI